MIGVFFLRIVVCLAAVGFYYWLVISCINLTTWSRMYLQKLIVAYPVMRYAPNFIGLEVLRLVHRRPSPIIILCQIIQTRPSKPTSLRYFNIFILYAPKSKRSPSSNCTTKSCVHSVPKYACYIPGHPYRLSLTRLCSFQI